MRIKLPLMAIGVASILALSTGSALANIPGTPDAAQMTYDHSIIPPGMVLAQTFVPTITGSLNAVEIYTSVYAGPTVVGPALPTDITVQIHSTIGNLPSSSMLAGETVAPANAGWDLVTFSSPAGVVAGTKYAILLYQGAADVAEWNGACADPYGPGAAMLFDTGDATWKSIPTFNAQSCITDFAFQTFITVATATPPPTSTTTSDTGGTTSNSSFLLIFAGLAAAASATVFASISRRRSTQR